jgi:rare lipoprotein A
LLGSALLSGCGHKRTPAPVPPPPSLPQQKEKPAATPPAETAGENEKIEVPAGAKPIFEQTGTASWYGAPYHNRRGSNGEVYNMHAMTAAHLTLPLGSIVRVTNLKSGHSALVRITDRGPQRRWMCTCQALRKFGWRFCRRLCLSIPADAGRFRSAPSPGRKRPPN